MKSVLNVKVDAETKKKAQRVAKQLGFNLSSLVNAYLKELIRDKVVSFSVEPGYRMTSQLEAELAEVEEDIKAGRNLGPILSTDEEIDAYFANRDAERRHARSAPSKVSKGA